MRQREERKNPAGCHGARREAPRQPWRTSQSSCRAFYVTIAAEDINFPVPPDAPMHVIGEDSLGAARRHPGAVPGDRDAPAQIFLPGVRRGSGSSPHPRTADQGRARRPRRWSPPCWLPNTPGICRSIGNPVAVCPRASTSSARSWRSGSVYAAAELKPHLMFGCASSF